MDSTDAHHIDLSTFTGPLTLSDNWYAYTLHMDRNRLTIDVRCIAENMYISKARAVDISIPDGIDYAINFQRCFVGYGHIHDISELESSVDSSKIISTELMFAGLHNLTNISPLSSWNVSNVHNMSGMFWCCDSLIDLNPLYSWKVQDDCDLLGFYSRYGYGDYFECPPLPWEEPYRSYNRLLIPPWLARKHIEYINQPQ